MCGGPTYSKCTVCKLYLHFNPTKVAHAGKKIMIIMIITILDLHVVIIGLATHTKSEWRSPSRVKEREIKRL